MYMTECGSDVFHKKQKTVRLETNPDDDAEMSRVLHTVVRRWRLFKCNAKTGEFHRAYLRGETPKQFKTRVRHCQTR
jgi:hypothetical protein